MISKHVVNPDVEHLIIQEYGRSIGFTDKYIAY
jgi:hypothetical protein